MDQSEFIRQLRATAEELAPLTHASRPGALAWNGTEYCEEPRVQQPDPYALSWKSVLTVIAGLLEAQEHPISGSQIKYLTRLLFGGMGSLNDLAFDSTTDIRSTVNERLWEQKQKLYESFK